MTLHTISNLTGKINLEVLLPPVESLRKIDNAMKLCFYRIIQEQVSNILKYSKAKNASVAIEIDAQAHNLTIEDDGIGFDVEEATMGIGLKNIESRCSLFNGTMDLKTAPGEGCLLRVKLSAVKEVYSN